MIPIQNERVVDMHKSKFEVRGRANKAHQIARFIRSQGYGLMQVWGWSDSQWSSVSSLAGASSAPSLETRGVVIGLMMSEEQAA